MGRRWLPGHGLGRRMEAGPGSHGNWDLFLGNIGAGGRREILTRLSVENLHLGEPTFCAHEVRLGFVEPRQ